MVSARQGLSLSQFHSAAPLQTLESEWRCTHDFFLHPVFLLVFLCAVQSIQIRSIPPGQKWPGFSFALHLLRVQGFYFAMLQYSPRHKTAHRALQRLLLKFAPFCHRKYQTDTSGYNTACTTLERITAPQHLQRIPDTRRLMGRCTGQHRPPIIIRYIRVRQCAPVMDPCQTAQHIADHASPARSAPVACGSLSSATPGAPADGSASPPVQGQPGGGLDASHARRDSPAAGARRAARNHWRLSPQLFSGFRPIANRGQQ